MIRNDRNPIESIGRRGGRSSVSQRSSVLVGWAIFFAVWEELGLLLVLFGAVPLLLLIAGANQRPLASPTDGPPFGDTGPT